MMKETSSEDEFNRVDDAAHCESSLQPLAVTRSLSALPYSPNTLGQQVLEDTANKQKREQELDEEILKRGIHPELTKRLFLYDADTYSRITPNYGPYTIDNECFSGQLFLMIRTPDVDGKSSEVTHFTPPPGTTPAAISHYFRDKKRQFEFQFQGKLKKMPPGPLYLGCELDKPVKMNMIQKTITSTVLNIIRAMNPGLHHSFGEEVEPKGKRKAAREEGRYEKAHLSFLLESSMDRIVVSKPGETVPVLGSEIHEDPMSVKSRKKIGTGSVNWNTDDTYTMSFWSAYVDYIRWKCKNLPGVRPFLLSSIIGDQSINLTVYALKDSKNQTQHLRKNKETYTHLRIENRSKT